MWLPGLLTALPPPDKATPNRRGRVAVVTWNEDTERRFIAEQDPCQHADLICRSWVDWWLGWRQCVDCGRLLMPWEWL